MIWVWRIGARVMNHKELKFTSHNAWTRFSAITLSKDGVPAIIGTKSSPSVMTN